MRKVALYLPERSERCERGHRDTDIEQTVQNEMLFFLLLNTAYMSEKTLDHTLSFAGSVSKRALLLIKSCISTTIFHPLFLSCDLLLVLFFGGFFFRQHTFTLIKCYRDP